MKKPFKKREKEKEGEKRAPYLPTTIRMAIEGILLSNKRVDFLQ